MQKKVLNAGFGNNCKLKYYIIMRTNLFIKHLIILLSIIVCLISQSCQKECLSGQDKTEYIQSCYSASKFQARLQVAPGVVSVTFNNECEDYIMTITQVGFSINTSFGLGGRAIRTRNDHFIVQPNSSQTRQYQLDIGDKVRSAYALENGIGFCPKD